MANIEFPQEAEQCEQKGADGIGLYRTEFLFMNRANHPDEDEHFNTYLQLLTVLDGIPVTIRTAAPSASPSPIRAA